MYRSRRSGIIFTGPTSTHVALRRTSFVRLRNLRYCVRRALPRKGPDGVKVARGTRPQPDCRPTSSASPGDIVPAAVPTEDTNDPGDVPRLNVDGDRLHLIVTPTELD